MKRKVLYLLLVVFLVSYSGKAQVSIIGSAVGDWSTDIDLTDAGDGQWIATNIILNSGEMKFRLNHNWVVNWGNTNWPIGVGIVSGPNIIAIAGNYDITFNQNTGEYKFTGYQSPTTIKLVGSAVANPDGLIMNTNNGNIYELTGVYLLNGNLQFNIDNNLSVGSNTFPVGIANSDLSIPIISSDYIVQFNLTTGEYVFMIDDSGMNPKVKIVGSAVIPSEGIEMTTLDGETFSLPVTTLLTGNAQFSFNGNLGGGVNFPSGKANSNSISIPVVAGSYTITVGYSTGVYDFKFPLISITGSAVGGWGIDTDLSTSDNGFSYFINDLNFIDGEIKFRQDHDWLINWGDPTSSNGNIFVTAGTYDITFTPSGTYEFGRTTGKGIWTFRDSLTKALVFTNDPALSSKVFNSANFKVYPNPSQNVWNFTSSNERIETIQIVDVLGKNVFSVSPKNNTVSIDASSLTKGIYFAKIATTKATETIKLIKN